LREGSRRNRHGYTLFFEKRASGPARLGLLVTRKHAARATVRNRIKRCIREAFRLEQETLGPVDLLVRPPFGVKPTPQMILQLRQILASLDA
jgi:ribonuclease P protein component